MKPVIIELDHITKTYRHFYRNSFRKTIEFFGHREQLEVLSDLSLIVNETESVGLFGANGSGKSTLLRIIAGIIKPDQGRVKVHRSVAAVLELGAGLHPELTGKENIELYAAILGTPGSSLKKNFSEIIEFTGLTDRMDMPIKWYSAGMRARLAFAVVAFSPAEILLLDEVFAVGDVVFVDKAMELLQSLRKQKTIILSSHSLDTLYRFCDRTIHLENGKIVDKNPGLQFLANLPVGETIITTVISNSMSPTLRKGDRVTVVKVEFDQLQVGDIAVVYLEKIGQLILHRLIRKLGQGKNSYFETQGDNSYSPDLWNVNRKNYFGKVILE